MKTVKYQLFIAAALFVGVVIGFFAGGGDSAVEQEPQEEGYIAKGKVADQGEAAILRVLRRRIAQLEKELAERRESADDIGASNAVAMVGEPGARGDRPRVNPRDWMENLKKTDPERYTHMTNQFARWRQRRLDRARNRIEFLSSVDTSRMSAAAQKTHNELQELIAQREELEEQMHQEDLSDEQRHQIMEQMRDTDRAMRKLNQQERTNLIEETARNLGFEGEDVKDISATLQEVIDATGGNGGHGMMPPPEGEAPAGGTPPPGGSGGR